MVTAEELYQMSDREGVCELVRGTVQRRPFLGYEEGQIVSRLGLYLASFVRDHRLGQCVGSRCGFLISKDPDTVRTAKFAFVRSCRATPPAGKGPFFPGPPDLAIEIISPSDRAGEIDEKVQDWLRHGCQVVWLVNPTTRTVTVFRSLLDIAVLTVADTLREPGLLPGFELPVREVFSIPQP